MPTTGRNISKLGIGELLTYKQLCEILEQPRYGGNQKKAQLKEFSRYFDYEYDKEIKKYVIKEIYDVPLDSSRFPVNTLYAKHIKVLLLSYLLRHNEKTIYISSQYLYKILGMINMQYIEMQRKDKKHELRSLLKQNLEDSVEEKTLNYYINNFYDRCRSKFSSIINNTLDSLERQNYITHSKAYHIYKRKLDEKDEIIETYYGGYSTDDETADFLEVERTVMDEFGFHTDKDIWFGGRTDEYWNRVLETIQELYPEVHKIYRCHKIIGTKSNIIKALSQEEETQEMHELNQKIMDFLDKQAESTMYRSIELNDTGDLSKQLSSRYLDAQHYLTDKLIKIK